jgi:hypothetical protein
LKLGSLSDFSVAELLQISKQPDGTIDADKENEGTNVLALQKIRGQQLDVWPIDFGLFAPLVFPSAHIFYHLAQSCHHGVAALAQITGRFMGL